MAERMSRIVVSSSSTAALTRSADLRPDGEPGRRLQLQAGGEEPLDHHVVQVPGDPLAVLQHDEQLALLLRPGPFERQRGLAGEARSAASGPRRRPRLAGPAGDHQQAVQGVGGRQRRDQGRAGRHRHRPGRGLARSSTTACCAR